MPKLLKLKILLLVLEQFWSWKLFITFAGQISKCTFGNISPSFSFMWHIMRQEWGVGTGGTDEHSRGWFLFQGEKKEHPHYSGHSLWILPHPCPRLPIKLTNGQKDESVSQNFISVVVYYVPLTLPRRDLGMWGTHSPLPVNHGKCLG